MEAKCGNCSSNNRGADGTRGGSSDAVNNPHVNKNELEAQSQRMHSQLLEAGLLHVAHIPPCSSRNGTCVYIPVSRNRTAVGIPLCSSRNRTHYIFLCAGMGHVHIYPPCSISNRTYSPVQQLKVKGLGGKRKMDGPLSSTNHFHITSRTRSQHSLASRTHNSQIRHRQYRALFQQQPGQG